MRGKTYLAAVFLVSITSLIAVPKSKAQSSQLRIEDSKTRDGLQLDGVQPEGSNTLQLSNVKEADPESRPMQSFGQIRLEGMQYLSPIQESPSLTYSQLLSARLSLLKETKVMDFALDVSGGTFFSRGQSHYVVHEAYVASRGEDIKVYAGRKKQDWSEMDRRWQLALFQPKFSIDTLRPEEQGLAGFFVDYDKEKLELLVFASPLYIPSMGPDIREESGGLVTDSRWYRTPSRDYDFNNRINTIYYDLDIPDTMKLASNPGGALMARVGSKERGPWMVISAGYKPVNELILKRQNFKDIAQDKLDVTVSPDVTYHDIRSVDIGYKFENTQVSLSYLEDNPVEKTPDTDWAIQKLEGIRAFSAAVDFTAERVWGRTLAFQLGYLKADGGGILDIREDGSADKVTLFDQRLQFTNAMSIRVEGQTGTFFRRPFVTRFKYLYDGDQKGSLINTEFLYYPDQRWAVIAGADILGVQDESYKTSSFLNQYRANDRFYGGMTYVF